MDRKLRDVDRQGSGGSFGKGIVRGLTSIGKAAGLAAGVGIAGGVVATGAIIGDSIHKAMDFQSELSTIQALTGASSAEMSNMQALALKMGADTKYSAMEAAQGIEELLKSGLTPAAVKAGGLEASLNLATAGGLDLAEAAATMSTSMNAFRKDGMSAVAVSNILAGTANAAATDVHELSYAIAAGGSVADMAGLSFQDFNSAIGLMSNDGLKSGSDAGTSFKSMLMYLQPQTKQATKLFNQLGIGVGKANKFFNKGKIKDIAGIAEVLHKAFGGMSEQMRTDKMMEMFGTDGVKAASTLFKAGADGVKEFQKEMSNVTALDVAKKKMDNAAGAVEQFKGAMETLQISGLTPLMPVIKRVASEAADFVTRYTPEITDAIQRMTDNATKYVDDHFLNNPEFKNLPTLESKVNFVFSDVMQTFEGWWAASGRDSMENVTEDVAHFMINVLDSTTPELAKVGADMGASLGKGMFEGLKSSKIGFLFKMTPSWWNELLKGDYSGAVTDWLVPDWLWKADNGSDSISSGGPSKPYSSDPIMQFNNSTDPFKQKSMPVAKSSSNSTTTFVYSPKQTFNGPVDKAAIEEATKSGGERFAEQYAKFHQQQRRVNLAE